MKCQNIFSGKNKKNIISLLSAEFAQRMVKVRVISQNNQTQYLLTISILKYEQVSLFSR